jgi:hypothetical protein
METQYLFIADTNHHRVIIANERGEIVDCVSASSRLCDLLKKFAACIKLSASSSLSFNRFGKP